MWYADRNYTKEELGVLCELEHDLFIVNPGFRAMWHDNFEEYFKGTLDEEYWEKREQERRSEIENTRDSEHKERRYDPYESGERDEMIFGLSDCLFDSPSRAYEQARETRDFETQLRGRSPLSNRSQMESGIIALVLRGL